MNTIFAVTRGWTLWSLAYLFTGFSLIQARGPINLDVIKRFGYGIVGLKNTTSNEFVVQGAINGRSVRLILDTGAAARNIILSNSLAGVLRVPPHPVTETGMSVTGKRIEHLRRGTVDSLVLGGVQIMNTTVDFGSFEFLGRRTPGGVFLRPSLTEAQENRRDADGFLGLGFLQRCNAIIDPANARLYLKPPGVGRVPALSAALKAVGFTEANLQLTSFGFAADVSVNDTASRMIIDTGAEFSIADSRLATQAKLKSYNTAGVRLMDASGNPASISWADPASFKVGGVDALKPRFAVRPTSLYDASVGKIGGVLGMDFIGQSWSIIDFAQHKFYFVATK